MKSQQWSEVENEAIVRAYIAMHTLANQGHKFSKAAIRRNLMAGPLAGRSEGSIEFKFMNVSGCFAAIGRLPLKGYQPAMNYQRNLMNEVCRQVGFVPAQAAS